MSFPDNASGQGMDIGAQINAPSANIAWNDSSNGSSLNTLNTGTFLKAFGALSSGYADYQSLQSKAAAERFNATIATNNAAMTAQESATNESALRLQQDREIGRQRANAAEAGIGPISQGSAGDALRQSQIDANLQALTERYRGTVQRTKFLNDANLSNYYAKVADYNSTQSIGNTGFSVMSKLLDGYGRYQAGSI